MTLPSLCVATASFNAEELIDNNWKVFLGEQDKRSAELTEVNLSKADFVTCLTPIETSISGEEKLSRLKNNTDTIRYGATVFMGLWKDYEVNKKNSILERLYCQKEITYLDFFGDVLGTKDGRKNVLLLYRRLDVWYWNHRWLEYPWRNVDLSVVSSQVS
ncbi:MAG: hypothetical protein AAB957_00800 [Patescibacteria group bacterium]